jgi:hypothetical protein
VILCTENQPITAIPLYMKYRVHTLTMPNIRNTILILSCTPSLFLCHQNSLNVRVWTPHGVESIPQGCWPMSTPIPQLCQDGWMSFGWRTSLDTHRKLLSLKKKPAALQLLTQTGEHGISCHTPFKGTLFHV